MTSGYRGKHTNWSDDVMGTAQNDERINTWGEIPGKIVSFDPQTQTATVKPLYKPKFNGQAVEMPDLYEIPVRFARGGNGALTFPVSEGDRVTLRPQMRDTELYHTEDDGQPSDARSFSLADMEAHLDGGESLKDPIQNFDAGNSHFRFDPDGSYGIRGSKDGKIAIEGNQGNIYTLICDAVKEAGDGFVLLGTEPALVHAAEYAQIGERLLEIEGKLRGMAL